MNRYISAAVSCALISLVSLTGCAKMKQSDHQEAANLKAETKREQASCASPVANQKLKDRLFDDAIGHHAGDRANLDMLADYSTVRMEAPVVVGRDDTLDLTRCAGRLILDVPPGAERGLAGERRLEEDIHYTAQASADGNGLVYQLSGADLIIAKLAAFKMTSVAFRPPPAIDDKQVGSDFQVASASAPTRQSTPDERTPSTQAEPASVRKQAIPPTREPPSSVRPADTSAPHTSNSSGSSRSGSTGDGVVRAFYGALRAGDGASASANVIPEKRSSGPYSAGAINRFYGALPEPVQLLRVTRISPTSYRVRYRYSAGRSNCNGSAIVGVINRSGRDLIRSIRALNGC